MRESNQNRKIKETGKHLRELKKNGGCPSQVYLVWCKCSSNCEFVIENHVGSFSFCGSVLYIELCKTLFKSSTVLLLFKRKKKKSRCLNVRQQ